MRAVIPDDADLLESSQKKDRVVHARFSRSEFNRIKAAASKAGLTISGFLRTLTLEEAGVQPFLSDDDRAILGLLVSDVRAVGVNLNQLARAVNRREAGRLNGERDAIDDVQRVLAIVLLELRAFAARRARSRVGTR
jgi:hypothetical protein